MRPQKRLHQRFRLMQNLLQGNGIKGRDTWGKKSQLVITSMSYINLLTQLKNAQAVKKENIKILFSKINETIPKILHRLQRYQAGKTRLRNNGHFNSKRNNNQ